MAESTQKIAAKLNDLTVQMEEQAGKLPLTTRPVDIIPSEGNPVADIMFIGEAPGYHETVERRPFVGRSGKFFRKTIEELNIKPKDVYIANIVKARPPENRDPTPEEIAAYKPFLDKEIELVQPKIICTLGRFSMAKFLKDVKISQVHGRLHKMKWNGKILYVLPLYHPAAGLRSTKVKESFIADCAKIPKAVKWIGEQEQTDELKNQVKDVLF